MKLDLEFHDTIPVNATPLEAVAMVKCLDENGLVTWYNVITDNLNLMEAFGMLMSAVVVTGTKVEANFEADPGDNDEHGDE